jgi:hypothetical protein
MKQSFTPVRVGRYTLPNRLVMAPMTRRLAELKTQLMEETDVGSGGVQLFRRIAVARECLDRSDRRLPLRSEHFLVQARGREIVTQHGVIIAVAADPAWAKEDQWAL